MVVLVAADSTETVAPSFALILYVLWVWLTVTSGVIAALKGQWRWLLLGLVTAGIGFIIGATRSSRPGSVLSRRRSRRARPAP